MNSSSTPRTSLVTFLTATLAAFAVLLGLAGPAGAADYTPDQRMEYFESGKYDQDLEYVAAYGRKFIIQRTQPTIKIVRACKAKGFRIGKADPGPDPEADYSVATKVPKHQLPDKIIEAPKPGPGPVTNPNWPRVQYPKAKKAKKITKKRCGNMPKLAIAMDMDETIASSFAYGSSREVYDDLQAGANLGAGTQTALKPMKQLYKLARNRGLTAFVITARPEPLLLRDVTERNLEDIGYTALQDVYLKPSLSADTATAKNTQRAEIVKRRGYKIIAMFGDQNSDLETGFYERGFKYQSPYGPDE
ncbi:MAG: HAD family acid phosphatase, partial [Solirubrobacterales bacterium]